MPRQARYIIEAVGELERQLRYAPRATRLRQMDAAEALAGEIDPQRAYPEEYIIYRITGYRPERTDTANAFVGAALRRDLANLVLRLSEDLDLAPDHAQRTAITLEEVARRLNVAPRTVQRYRQQGLICHHVQFPDASNTLRKRIACYEDALERFTNHDPDRVQHASAFSRIDDSIEQSIITEARRLHRERHCTLNEAAKCIARSIGRAHETVRGMLQRHDTSAREPIFAERGPLSDNDRRVIYRAWRFGVPINELADRFEHSAQSVRRAINRERGTQLNALELTAIALPTFEHEEADSILLGHSLVANDLWPDDDLLANPLELIDMARSLPGLNRNDELAIVAGYNFLKHRPAMNIAQMTDRNSARSPDAIETDLRWAALVKQRLMILTFPGALEAIEQHLGRSLDSQPASMITAMLRLAYQVTDQSIDSHDPAREQRLRRRTRFAMDRALAQHGPMPTESRAAARHRTGSLLLHEPMATLVPWWRLLMPRGAWRKHSDSLDGRIRRVVAARYGWDGGPPHRVLELARKMNTNEPAIARLLDRAEQCLRRAARSATETSR